jgi:hypothetical protein
MSESTSTLNGPLHPDIIPHLDSDYAAFYNKNLAHRPAVHKVPWDPACRIGPINLGGLEPCKVGSVRDLTIPGSPPVKVRVFTPPGEQPSSGWPALAYYHGGGWVLGNIDTENSFSARTCLSKCPCELDKSTRSDTRQRRNVWSFRSIIVWRLRTRSRLRSTTRGRHCSGSTSMVLSS